MSRIELLPPPPEACLEKAYPSSQKGGTLIAAGVIDLETHERLLCDPDQYRPAMCLNCRKVIFAHRIRPLLAPRVLRILFGVSGVVLVGFGLRLVYAGLVL